MRDHISFRYFLAAIFLATCSTGLAATVSTPSNFTAAHRNGRQIRLSWGRSTSTEPIVYDVYRDDVLLASIPDGEKDPETNGEVWDTTSANQVYMDNTGWPEQTHFYYVRARVEGGEAQTGFKEVTIARPIMYNVTISRGSGRKVGIRWKLITGAFFEQKYEIYRDGEFVGAVDAIASGSEESGNSWMLESTGYFNYYDSKGIPGVLHTYTIVAKPFEGYETEHSATMPSALTVPTLSNFAASGSSGREVRLSWGRISGDFFTVGYDIYRDDVKIASFMDGEIGTGEKGDSWSSSATNMSYIDVEAIPGQTHTYMGVATLFDDFTVSRSSTLTISTPSWYNFAAKFNSGRSVSLSWARLTGRHLDIVHTIFRNGELIGTFRDGETGQGEEGGKWSASSSNQSFEDTTAIPGQTYDYVAIATLYENGVQLQKSASVTVAGVSFPSISVTNNIERTIGLSWTPIKGNYFDLVYEVIRDGESIAIFPANVEGSDEQCSWSATSYWQNFYDHKAQPGGVHTYQVIGTYFPDFQRDSSVEVTARRTTLTGMTISYTGVRSVQIYWTRQNESRFDIEYTVYRDDEELATFPAAVSGSHADGHSWRISGNNQYFVDGRASPGKTHTYRVVAKLADDCSVSLEKDFAVPSTILPVPTCAYESLRTVRLYWNKVAEHATFDVEYTLYRDGEWLATFPALVEGGGEAGDSWKSDATRQYYYDVSAVPYATHTYTLEVRLFPGCTVTQEREFAVPGPKVTAPVFTINSDSQVSIALGIIADNGFSDATMEVYRNGDRVGSLGVSNGRFVTPYVDGGFAVPAEPYHYQFLVTLYPGCYWLSDPFDLVIPTPPLPKVAVSPVVPGAISLTCTGGSSPTPQYYMIYRDGLHVGNSETGAKVTYVDDTVVSGRLHRYHIRARFDGFQESVVSSPSVAAYETAPLAEGEDLAVATHRTSSVSPAWIEGDSSQPRRPFACIPDFGEPASAFYYTDTAWYVDNASALGGPHGLLLNPDAPTRVRFVPDGDGVPVVEDFIWTPTDVAGRTAGEAAIHVRLGDSLLLTAGGPGVLLEIDGDGDGEYELSGIPGQTYPVAFHTSGEFNVAARIDGEAVGALRVAVADVSMNREVAYTLLYPTGTVAPQATMLSDKALTLYPELATYLAPMPGVTFKISKTLANSIQYLISTVATEFGETWLQSRFTHYRGPLLAACKVRSIVQSIEGRSYSPILQQYEDGSCLFGNSVRLKKAFPELSVKMSITNSGPVFADTGTSTRIITYDEFDANDQANVYIIATPKNASSAGYTVIAEIVVTQ